MIKYDLSSITSFSETCPLTPLEAMKAKLPMLLSDIPAFKEIAVNAANYFQLRNVDDFIKTMESIVEGKIKIDVNDTLYGKILKQYSKSNYIKRLSAIYLNNE